MTTGPYVLPDAPIELPAHVADPGYMFDEAANCG